MNSNRKKLYASGLALSLLMLAGCSSQSSTSDAASLTPEQQSAKEVVENYLSDFKEAKLEESDSYVDPDDNTLQFGTAMATVAQLYDALGLSQDQIDLMKNALNEALASMVRDYTIKEITTDSDNKVTVNVDITGISPESLAEIENNDLVDAMSDTIAQMQDGELDNESFQNALDTVVDKIKEQASTTEKAAFTVEDVDGKWLITDTENFADLEGSDLAPEGAGELETIEEVEEND